MRRRIFKLLSSDNVSPSPSPSPTENPACQVLKKLIKDYNNQIFNKIDEKHDLDKKIKNAENELKKLTGQLSGIQENINQTDKRIADISESIKKSQEYLSEDEKELTKLKNDLKKFQEENSSCLKSFTIRPSCLSIKAQERQKIKEISFSENQISELKNEIENSKTLEKNKKKELYQLNQQKIAIEDSIKSAKKTINDGKKRKEEIPNEIEELKNKKNPIISQTVKLGCKDILEAKLMYKYDLKKSTKEPNKKLNNKKNCKKLKNKKEKKSNYSLHLINSIGENEINILEENKKTFDYKIILMKRNVFIKLYEKFNKKFPNNPNITAYKSEYEFSLKERELILENLQKSKKQSKAYSAKIKSLEKEIAENNKAFEKLAKKQTNKC